MLKFRTKIEAGLVLLFLLIVSISSVLGTVIISDNSITDDSLGTVLSFDNDWIDFANGTFTNSVTVDGRVLDTTDFNSWDASGGSGGGDYEITKIMNNIIAKGADEFEFFNLPSY